MLKFEIDIRSFQQVQDFEQTFDIRVGNDSQHINGKDLMGMFSLDFSRPLQVRVLAEQEDFDIYRQKVEALLAE